jgi:predicted nuclease with TOPRIM domain
MTVDQQFNSIHEKLQTLVRQHGKLKKENEALRQQLEQQKKDNSELEGHIVELQNIVSIMKLAAGNMNDKEKKDFEKQINRFVKEIDKCIAYLSV